MKGDGKIPTLIRPGQRGLWLKAVSDPSTNGLRTDIFRARGFLVYISGNAALYLAERLSDVIASSRSC